MGKQNKLIIPNDLNPHINCMQLPLDSDRCSPVSMVGREEDVSVINLTTKLSLLDEVNQNRSRV